MAKNKIPTNRLPATYGKVTITSTSSTPNTVWADVTGGSITLNLEVDSIVILTASILTQKTNAAGRVDLRILKDGATQLVQCIGQGTTASATIQVPIHYIDLATAGSHTYKLQYSDQLAAAGAITILDSTYSHFSALAFSQ